MYKFAGKKPKAGIDYEENEDTFTIYNVPILAEMVQDYSGTKVLKSANEILKVEVNNVPLTIVDEKPTHPDHIRTLDTFEKKDVIVGYMSDPAKPKTNASKTKRYADFVLHNIPKIQALKNEYINGTIIDTSIGFDYEEDNTVGIFNGEEYSMVQRDIVLDHNAILIDRVGNIGTGRMPSPIGGIGADSKTNEGIKVSKEDENKKVIEDLQKEVTNQKKVNEDLKKEVDAFKKATEDKKKKDEDDKKGVDEIRKDLDSAKMETDKFKLEMKDMKKDLDKANNDLKVFTDKEKEAIDSKREDLKKHYDEADAELIDKADADWINKRHAKINDKKNNKDIGADMMGSSPLAKSAKSQTKRFEAYQNSLNGKDSKKKTEGDE